jgi:hypothetical protein
MNKKTKIALSILAIGITATTGYLVYKRIQKNKRNKQTLSGIDENRIEEIKTTPVSISNPPTQTEITAVVSTQPSTIAITNKTEGDAFRGWINDTYPDYARQIDLDRTGSYNNSYITKAWKKYGTEYTNANVSVLGKVSNALNTLANSETGTNVLNILKPIGQKGSSILQKIAGQTPVPNPSGQFSPKNSAENLYNSMKGWGTNEKLFFDTLRPLTQSQRIQVREYYDTNGTGKSLGTLEMSIRGDFGGTELQEALQLIHL